MVTPTYYVLFTSSTIITSAVLFQGFAASGKSIATVVLGFLQICAGVVLLQLSKSAKELPDAAVFKGDLDQIREVGSINEPESEPKADSIRGAAAIVRQLSTKRQHDEQEEVNRVALRPVEEKEEEQDQEEKQETLPRLRNRSPRTIRTPSGRQFSFTTMLNRLKPTSPIPRPTLHPEKQALKNASEEERLGLVDNLAYQPDPDHHDRRSAGDSNDSTLDTDNRISEDSDSTLGDGQALLTRLHQSLDEAQLDYQSERQVSGSTASVSVHDSQPDNVHPLHCHSPGDYAHPHVQMDPNPNPSLSTLRSADQLRLERSSSGWRRGNDL